MLVFDDASSDGTSAVLSAVDDSRLRVIRSDEPFGVARGLNRLLVESDSEFIGRMDADDACIRGRFRRQATAMRSMDVAFTTVVEWRDGRSIRPNPPLRLNPVEFPYHLLLTNPVAHPTMFARRASLAAVDGYREVPAEDYDLWIRLASSGAKLGRLAIPGLLYRLHGGQVTASAEWRLNSWRNPLVAAAFGSLSEQLLGKPFPRLTALAVDRELSTEQFDSTLADFSRSISAATATWKSGERRRLLSVLSRRVIAVRGIGDSSMRG